MYETMVGWENDHTLAERSPLMRDFAELWQAADKIVYSRTLEAVSTSRTWIERDFDPRAVRQMKASAGRDMTGSSGPASFLPGSAAAIRCAIDDRVCSENAPFRRLGG
jgi:hypothetical protein